MTASAHLQRGARQRACDVTLGLVAAQLLVSPALADDSACRTAYVETQRLQRAASLRAAQRQALTCGQDSCSSTVRTDCAQWLESIERAMPSVVIDARDANGDTLTDVRVEVDGEPLAHHLNGRALAVDPGEHRFRFVHQGAVVQRDTLIREGEKYRALEVRFDEASPAPDRAPPVAAEAPSLLSVGAGASPAIPNATYVLGGVGVLGVGAFGVFAARGYLLERRLRERCEGACAHREVQDVRRSYLIADVGLGLGVAALAGALVAWRWGSPDPDAPIEAAAAPTSAWRLELAPRALSWSGTF